MNNLALPKILHSLFEKQNNLDVSLTALMAITVKLLDCDRCFLYVRDPDTRLGKAAFCFCRNNKIPDVTGSQWQRESFSTESDRQLINAIAKETTPLVIKYVQQNLNLEEIKS
jgi:GAF domain-containing protein